MTRLGKHARDYAALPFPALCGLVLIAFTMQSTLPALAGDNRSGELVIAISGLKTDQGLMMVALMNSAVAFESDSEAFRNDSVPVRNGQATVTFRDLPFGSYAVKVYHDENSNGELDTSFVGFPKEAFGFSNDAMGRFGPPKFEQAKFEFASEQQKIEIRTK